MSSLREQILQAVVTALNTSRPTGVPAAERARNWAIDPDQLPKILVYAGRDSARDVGGRRGPAQEKRLELEIECWAAKSQTLSADAAADPLYLWVVKALADKTLGGLVSGLREDESSIALEEVDAQICLTTVRLSATYQQRADNPERAA